LDAMKSDPFIGGRGSINIDDGRVAVERRHILIFSQELRLPSFRR
jgi:hypothetical protein